MARQWTVMVVRDDDSAVQQFQLSHVAFRVVMVVMLSLVVGISAGITAILMHGYADADARLVEKNLALASELHDLTNRLDTLQFTLRDLSAKDEYYRLLAGLEPLDEDVRKLGIGGPDADSLGANRLYRVDSEAGRRAHNVSTQVNTLLRRAKLLSFSWSQAEDTLTEKQARLSATPSIYPTIGYVSSTFSASRWHPILDKARPHTGIDIVAPHGTPVVASARGRIAAVGPQGAYGLLIEIDHGRGVVTRYAHLGTAPVRVGQIVDRGQKIGTVGASGLALGPHLHYEVLVNGQPANPRRFILDMESLPD